MHKKSKSSSRKANQSINGLNKALLKLSAREGQILLLVVQGKTTQEMAKELYLSIRTVENHRYHIGKKLGLKGKGAIKEWVRSLKE